MPGEFWRSGDATPVTRRVVFGFSGKRGELNVSVTPGRPIPDLANVSERMMLEATVPAAQAQPGQTVYPQFVFATVEKGEAEPVVYGPGHRAIGVLRLPAEPGKEDTLDYAEKLAQAKEALPPAPARAGDGAIGFLVRTDVLHFYPLVGLPPAEHEHFQEGTGSTDDLIQALPFQS
ncbi:MAG: hypothetical protein Q8Q11_03380 [bacterium]|nr:hypothetical protein [bacterium]MDZ4248313.1 hypothetical protein [Patescibacteria group bacterium]